jgi:RNA polymerase sigma-70 factor (ECF subfamily)
MQYRGVAYQVTYPKINELGDLHRACQRVRAGAVYTGERQSASMPMRCMVTRFVRLQSACLDWPADVVLPGDRLLDNSRALNAFLSEVERRALRMADMQLRDIDDALDVVQEAMIKLARKYAARPASEWRPLFFRILQNGIRDVQRRRTVRKRLFAWLPSAADTDDGEAPDPLANIADAAPQPPTQLMQTESMHKLESLLGELPARQREAFMLRNFEGLDVEGTALAMGCTAGSVKTHYSRAVHFLREQLGEVW